MPDSQDEHRVARAQAGDREAYASLVQVHYRRVFLTCLAVVGQAADAEDVAQEVFLKAWVEIRRLRDGAQFLPWVLRIARNQGINQLRSKGSRQRTLERLAAPTSAGQVATHRVDVEQALGRLPAELREALVRYYFDGQDVKGMAQRLEVSASAVYQRLRRATEQLHALLVNQGDLT